MVEISPAYVILQNKKPFIKNFEKICGMKTNFRSLFIYKESSVKKSEKVCMLIFTYFESLFQKFQFQIEVALNSLSPSGP